MNITLENLEGIIEYAFARGHEYALGPMTILDKESFYNAYDRQVRKVFGEVGVYLEREQES